MDDFTGTDESVITPRRSFADLFAGDTADEIELAALDEARQIFGPEPQLHIVPDYRIGPLSDHAQRRYGDSKKYCAHLLIRVTG